MKQYCRYNIKYIGKFNNKCLNYLTCSYLFQYYITLRNSLCVRRHYYFLLFDSVLSLKLCLYKHCLVELNPKYPKKNYTRIECISALVATMFFGSLCVFLLWEKEPATVNSFSYSHILCIRYLQLCPTIVL